MFETKVLEQIKTYCMFSNLFLKMVPFVR